MSSRRFPLSVVLRVRRIEEDIARAEVRRRQAARAAAEADLHRREAELDRRGPALEPGVAASIAAGAAANLALAAAAGAARARRAQAQSEVDLAVAGWTTRRGRVHSLEELEQRHRQALAVADAQAEAAEVDDLSAAKAGRAARTARAATATRRIAP